MIVTEEGQIVLKKKLNWSMLMILILKKNVCQLIMMTSLEDPINNDESIKLFRLRDFTFMNDLYSNSSVVNWGRSNSVNLILHTFHYKAFCLFKWRRTRGKRCQIRKIKLYKINITKPVILTKVALENEPVPIQIVVNWGSANYET